MNLTQFSDLGLRTMMHLVSSKPKRTTAQEVADAIGAPVTHVSKVISRLNEFGIVTATRGRGGGLSPVEEAGDYTVGSLVRFLEGSGEVVECEGSRPCPFNTNCQLRRELAKAQEAFFQSLDQVTIKEVAPAQPLPARAGNSGRQPHPLKVSELHF